MILSALATDVMAQLLSDQGTNDYWNVTDIKIDANWLYRDIAETFECLKERDETTLSIINIARYVIPISGNVESILRLINVEYDNEPLPYKTIKEVEEYYYKWRTLDASIPVCCTMEKKDLNRAITLVPKSDSTNKVIAFTFSYLPIPLTDSDSPIQPLTDCRILKDGLMSMQLAKAGGGRDLDRSDWYFSQFLSKCSVFGRHTGFGTRRFKSIENTFDSKINTRSYKTPIGE